MTDLEKMELHLILSIVVFVAHLFIVSIIHGLIRRDTRRNCQMLYQIQDATSTGCLKLHQSYYDIIKLVNNKISMIHKAGSDEKQRLMTLFNMDRSESLKPNSEDFPDRIKVNTLNLILIQYDDMTNLIQNISKDKLSDIERESLFVVTPDAANATNHISIQAKYAQLVMNSSQSHRGSYVAILGYIYDENANEFKPAVYEYQFDKELSFHDSLSNFGQIFKSATRYTR